MAEKYLIIPSVPTPNGGLHLGHIGGPYLSADIIARHLRMQGNEAALLSGTDSYESYVMGQSLRENSTNPEICNKYHDVINTDLNTMNIKMDAFINPLALASTEKFAAVHYDLLHGLQAQNATKQIAEYIPYDLATKEFITGFALHGKCPECKENISGYFCEQCGAYFKPEDVLAKQTTHEKQVTNLFLQIPAVTKLGAKGISQELLKKYEHSIYQQKNLLRLTTHASWGMPAYDNQQVLFSYAFIYAYLIFLGENAQFKLRESVNPFSEFSKVKLITTFGVDNTVPFISSIESMSQVLKEYRPMDYYVVNHFYHLDGKKFSTSKRHAIWVSDIKTSNLNVDIVRLYLASIDVRSHSGNFEQIGFTQFYNKVEHFINGIFNSLDHSHCHSDLTTKLKNYISKQQQFYSPQHFRPHEAVKNIFELISIRDEFKSSGNAYAQWLKTLTILAYPIMPHTCQFIWNKLGCDGVPSYKNYNENNDIQLQKVC